MEAENIYKVKKSDLINELTTKLIDQKLAYEGALKYWTVDILESIGIPIGFAIPISEAAKARTKTYELTYQQPTPLVATLGSSWEYQESPEVMDTLNNTLPQHYTNWKQSRKDKQLHPIYLICSGPGTGKSRLLNEFPNLYRKIAKNYKELSDHNSKESLVMLCRDYSKLSPSNLKMQQCSFLLMVFNIYLILLDKLIVL